MPGWIDPGTAGARFWAAEVRPDGKAVALEFSSPATGFGVVLAAADGTLGGATELKCFLPGRRRGDGRLLVARRDDAHVGGRPGRQGRPARPICPSRPRRRTSA